MGVRGGRALEVQERLPKRACLLHDGFELRLKAKIEHPVSFVKHEKGAPSEHRRQAVARRFVRRLPLTMRVVTNGQTAAADHLPMKHQ